jgi:hypothetical protein
MTLHRQEILEQLQLKAYQLKLSQVSLLIEMADNLRKNILSERNSESGMVTLEFMDSFADRLLIHHAMGAEKFSKKPFEFAFVRAMRAAGRQAEIAESGTDPGADIIVGDERYSLKTEAAKKISSGSITVSKLAEARWIRDDGKNAEWLFNGIYHKVLPRFDDYEHVLILRAFDATLDGGPAVRYELVEVPLDLLREVKNVVLEDIKVSQGKNGGGSVRVLRMNREHMKHLFTLTFDGSVEKLRLSSLKMDECILHAKWIIPIPLETAFIEDEED